MPVPCLSIKTTGMVPICPAELHVGIPGNGDVACALSEARFNKPTKVTTPARLRPGLGELAKRPPTAILLPVS